MGDGVLLTRFLFGLLVAGPPILTTIVLLVRRSRVTRVVPYLLASVVTGYALSVGVPLSIVLVSMLLGAVAEVAALIAIVFSIPLLLALQTGAAVLWATRFGEEPPRSGATATSRAT